MLEVSTVDLTRQALYMFLLLSYITDSTKKCVLLSSKAVFESAQHHKSHDLWQQSFGTDSVFVLTLYCVGRLQGKHPCHAFFSEVST